MQFQNMKEELNFLKRRYRLTQQLESIVNAKGYIKVEPDYFEPYERFMRMNKRIEKTSMVKMLENDGSISILRPDITTNIIKQVIPKWTDDLSMRLFYTSTTFAQKPGQKIFEDRQFGIELLGDVKDADAEVVNLMVEIMETFQTDYMIEIGNQRFLNALFESLGLSEDDERTLKDIIDAKNLSALQAFIKQLPTSNETCLLDQLFELEGSFESINTKLSGCALKPSMSEALNELKIIHQTLNTKKTKDRIAFDLSLISKFDYYEGITFKGYINGVSEPLLSGGRYDPLTEAFGKRIPAIGFSIHMVPFIKEVIK